MESGAAYVTQPILRMTRLVGNVMLDREQNDVVRSKWIMHIYRANAPELFSGDCEHRLVREEGKLKIAAKKVLLINDKFEFGYMPLV
jgi:3-phenylpropionate/cinnamic acid dioxygenase small subunit